MDEEAVVDVGIDIDRDVLAIPPRGCDAGEGEIHLPPVGLAGGFQVIDMHRGLRRFPDAQGFVDGLEQSVALW